MLEGRVGAAVAAPEAMFLNRNVRVLWPVRVCRDQGSDSCVTTAHLQYRRSRRGATCTQQYLPRHRNGVRH